MKKLIVFACVSLLFTSCKVVRIEGTPNVSVTNSEANPVPVTVQNGPGIQRVEVTNFPVTNTPPANPERIPFSVSRRLSSKNGFSLKYNITPRAGYDLVVEYYAVSLDGYITTEMKLGNYVRFFGSEQSGRTESEQCKLLVSESMPLMFSANPQHHDTNVTLYVSGYEVKK